MRLDLSQPSPVPTVSQPLPTLDTPVSPQPSTPVNLATPPEANLTTDPNSVLDISFDIPTPEQTTDDLPVQQDKTTSNLNVTDNDVQTLSLPTPTDFKPDRTKKVFFSDSKQLPIAFTPDGQSWRLTKRHQQNPKFPRHLPFDVPTSSDSSLSNKSEPVFHSNVSTNTEHHEQVSKFNDFISKLYPSPSKTRDDSSRLQAQHISTPPAVKLKTPVITRFGRKVKRNKHYDSKDWTT